MFILSTAWLLKPWNQIEHHHLCFFSTLIFTQLFYHSNHPKPACERKDVIKRKQYLELMVNAFTIPQMSDVTVLFLEILWILGIPCGFNMVSHEAWFGNCRLWVTYIVHAYEWNLGVSDPRFMSFFCNIHVLLDKINFNSVLSFKWCIGSGSCKFTCLLSCLIFCLTFSKCLINNLLGKEGNLPPNLGDRILYNQVKVIGTTERLLLQGPDIFWLLSVECILFEPRTLTLEKLHISWYGLNHFN